MPDPSSLSENLALLCEGGTTVSLSKYHGDVFIAHVVRRATKPKVLNGSGPTPESAVQAVVDAVRAQEGEQ